MKIDIKSFKNTFAKFFKNTNGKMLLCALLLFVSVLLYLPQSSVVRSIPLVLLFSATAFGVYPNLLYNLGVHFVLSFLFHMVYGVSLFDSVLLSVFAIFYALLAIFVLVLIIKYRKEKSKANKKRCILYIMVCFAVALVVYTLMCGNIFSASSAHSKNLKYVSENYGDNVNVMYTSFD